MISILITSYKEPNTIGRAIDAFLNQKIDREYEILVGAPDKETGNVVLQYTHKYPQVRWVQDQRKGKPAALNMLFKEAKGEYLILSDGDVYASDNAVNQLLKHFENPQIGIVSGRPVSLSPRKTMLGYWSHLLTDAGAHELRIEKTKLGEFIPCSGYLFAMRKLFNTVPEDVLSEDAIMSYMVWERGYFTAYEPEAKVFVKYPATFKDWMIQKRRSAGGYKQVKKYFKGVPQARSFWREALYGWLKALGYAESPKESLWTLALFGARAYLWLKIFVDFNVKSVNLLEIWKPVESTK